MKEYEFEYYFMSPREKLEARRAADKLGVDKTYLAALMTGFHKSIYYEPVYAPLFIIDDTLIVFDHYKNKLFKFNEFYEPADSISINYHFIQNDKKWIKQLIRDEATDKIYTVHEKSGYYYLSSLNLYSGESELIIKLSHPYPENIRIKNGHVYYIYRPFGSAQNKFLYRERL
jgi:hypothetical protein